MDHDLLYPSASTAVSFTILLLMVLLRPRRQRIDTRVQQIGSFKQRLDQVSAILEPLVPVARSSEAEYSRNSPQTPNSPRRDAHEDLSPNSPSSLLKERFQNFGKNVGLWCNLVDEEVENVWQNREDLALWIRLLKQSPEQGTLDQVDREFRSQAAKTMQVILSTSDRDVDRERDNPALQNILSALLKDGALSVIDPRPGDPVDYARHHMLGVVQGSRDQRGTVAKVLARGLLSEYGDVISKAEVREFD